MASLLDGAVATLAGNLGDALGAVNGLRGDDPDDWDPEYIERTLPLLGATFGNYFRGEVRGLENIPADGPVAARRQPLRRHYIADTFVFALEFYEHFGP